MTRFTYCIPLLSILLSFNVLLSQNYDDLFILYNNKKLERLQSRLGELEKRQPNDQEIVFFKTIFNDNGEEAIKIYQDLYESSGGKVKSLIAKKMSEYYFAQGYYVKAQEFKRLSDQEFPVKAKDKSKSADNNKVKSVKVDEHPKYIIQVGAFGVEKNADELADVLRRKKIDVKVVDRNINGEILYCVWIEGDSDYSLTKSIAEDVKSQYKLTYRILKP
jgi:hypothetical protein